MRNYYSLHVLQTNMADVCEESSSDCSDSISGNNSNFYLGKEVAQKKLQNEEPRTSSSSAGKRKSHSEESNSSAKRSANRILRKRQSKLRERVVLASKANLLVKTPLHENRKVASFG